MSLEKEGNEPVKLLQAVISLHFVASFFIIVMTIIGVSYGYEISSFFLMALLQALIAVPGVVYETLQTKIWLVIYISIQLMTVVCETYWLFVMVIDKCPARRWIGLAILILLNLSAAAIAFWFREKTVNFPRPGKKKTGKSDAVKAPPASMSEDIEKSRTLDKTSSVSPTLEPENSSLSSKKSSRKLGKKKSSRMSIE